MSTVDSIIIIMANVDWSELSTCELGVEQQLIGFKVEASPYLIAGTFAITQNKTDYNFLLNKI